MNDAQMPATPSQNEQLITTRRSTETKVTLDLSRIPAKAQQAISAWLSQSDQQAIVDALSAMARKVDTELQAYEIEDRDFNQDQAAEIVVIPSFKGERCNPVVQPEVFRAAA